MQGYFQQAYGRYELMQDVKDSASGSQGQKQGDANEASRLQLGSRAQDDKQDEAYKRNMMPRKETKRNLNEYLSRNGSADNNF
jgi:hypothetical protein